MPYTPPTGNAVNFNFTGSYSAPAGNAVIFNFGGSIPPPPPGTLQKPTGLRQAYLHEDDWYFIATRRFAPVTTAAPAPIGLRHSGLDRFRFEEPESWLARRQEIRFVPPFARTRRAVLFTVT
jgi:hypothetical protein